MANVDTFPLLKLPYLPLENVIQQFDAIHKRFYLATLSRRAAILVKSLRDIKVLGLKLTVLKNLTFSIIFLDQGGIRHQEWIHKEHPNTLVFPFSEAYNRLRKLIDTMFFIFGLSGFDEFVVRWEENCTLKMSRLQNLLQNIKTIKFNKIYSSGFHEGVLAEFPSVRNVSMTGKPNDHLLNRKLEVLEYSSQRFYGLDLVNCESLQIKPSLLIWVDFNQFLKSWIQGLMPRLRHARIWSLLPMRQDLIFEGIVNKEADRNREMTFKSYSLNLGDPKTTVVQGGVDIKSENGARATITIQTEEPRFAWWNMNVWD